MGVQLFPLTMILIKTYALQLTIFIPQYEEPRRKRPVVIRDERSADEITEDDLNMVAEFVIEKKYDSIYVSRIHLINPLPPGKFFMLFCRLLIFFKINFFEKFFHEYHLNVKQIGSRSGPTFCRA